MRLDDLTRGELAVLVPELLLCGHLIDRSGMPHLISAFGRDGMRDVAIDEWRGASPVYTARMQRALRFEGDTVETVFKGMQLDIGAPPQFMDFRYALHGPAEGEFWLDHCGALMDVEPMGDDYVVAMCHDIEDPTFEATAVATNRRARLYPVHRPPRTPVDRSPHCHWAIRMDGADDLPVPEETAAMAATRAAAFPLAEPDASEEGLADYSGPLLADLRFEDFSRSALLRIAGEVCLQWHLLVLSFRRAVAARTDEAATTEILRHQFTGIAGLTAERLRGALDLGTGPEAVAALLRLHPAFGPGDYAGLDVDVPTRPGATADPAAPADPGVVVRLRFDPSADAVADGAWVSTLSPDHLEPLDAVVRAVDPRLCCRGAVVDGVLEVEVVTGVERAEHADVALTRFSTGAGFAFEDRGVPVTISPR